MLQQLPHHTRIICTRKYARTLAHTTANLVSLPVRGINKDDDDGAVAPAAATLGKGAWRVCHGTRGDTIRSRQSTGKTCFLLALLHVVVHTTTPTTCFPPRLEWAALRDRKGGECVVPVAVYCCWRAPRPSDRLSTLLWLPRCFTLPCRATADMPDPRVPFSSCDAVVS